MKKKRKKIEGESYLKNYFQLNFYKLGEKVLNNKSIWHKNNLLLIPVLLFIIVLFSNTFTNELIDQRNKLLLEWTYIRVPTENFDVLDYRYAKKNKLLLFHDKVLIDVKYQFNNITDKEIYEYYDKKLLETNWQKVKQEENKYIYSKEQMYLFMENKGNGKWDFSFSISV